MPQTERNEAAEKAIKESQRQYARYKRNKHAHRRELYTAYPRLREFTLQLHRFGGTDAVPFLRYVREENRGWLCTATPEVYEEAVQLISERIQRIRGKAGLVPFDDPIPSLSGRAAGAEDPGEPDDVWQLIRQELAR